MKHTTGERFAALSHVATALMSELDEDRLMRLIAETARELTGAAFAAFSLRPVDEEGQPLVPSEGNLFHLAAVVGVTPEQEALFRRVPLGGEGVLAPIFRHGVSVLVPDILTHISQSENPRTLDRRHAAFASVHGQRPKEAFRSRGVPRGHPVVRSFLGAPLLDRSGEVRGGLLLGHPEPDQFTQEDETLLVGLAAQAAVALENARLYRASQVRARQLDALFESSADGIILVDAQGSILRETGTAHRLREKLVDAFEGERTIEELLHTPVRRALAGGAVEDVPMSVIDDHNEAREYLVSASPLHLSLMPSGPLSPSSGSTNTSQNDMSGAVVAWHDITERRLRESEQQALEHARQLETIFEAMTDGVFVYDHTGKIVQMNTTARTLFALDIQPEYASLPLEKRIAQLVAYDRQGQMLSTEHFPMVRLLKGEVLTGANAMDVLVQALDGREIPVSIGGAPLYDQEGHITGAVMTVRDMSERHRLGQLERRMHAETETRRAMLQMILDELPSSVYLVHGNDARLVLANRAASKVWGASWSQDQPMSEFLSENGIRIFSMDGRALVPEQLATLRAVQHGESVYQQQETIRHPDGTTVPVLVNAVALDVSHLFSSPADRTKPLAEGSEPMASVVHQDMTALKEAERLKDEFVAIAAHELRNPLAVLQGHAQTLVYQSKRGRGPQLEEWQKEALENIDKATLRLVELIADLLDVTRLQAGRLELYLEPTDLVALVQRVVKRLQVTTKQHHLSVITSLDHLVVSIDPGRMEQVLNNLIQNAIKYSPAGGLIEITVSIDHKTGDALLSVHDYGIGIPLHQQARIFGRFERADNARPFSGTGLGLYLCRALVEQQGGRIWFESVEGAGSTFFVALPPVSNVEPLLQDGPEDLHGQ